MSGLAFGEQVTATFNTTASTTTVMQVLTDYDHLSSIVPSLLESRVIKREDLPGITVVRQVGVAKWFTFSKRITVELVILPYTLGPDTLGFAFVDALKKDFNSYQGYWEVDTKGKVTYSLLTDKKFYAPKNVSEKVMKRVVKDLVNSVKVEIERRNANPLP